MSVQRDYGNRAERNRARFKYTIDDKGLAWIKAEIESRLGVPFAGREREQHERREDDGEQHGSRDEQPWHSASMPRSA